MRKSRHASSCLGREALRLRLLPHKHTGRVNEHSSYRDSWGLKYSCLPPIDWPRKLLRHRRTPRGGVDRNVDLDSFTDSLTRTWSSQTKVLSPIQVCSEIRTREKRKM